MADGIKQQLHPKTIEALWQAQNGCGGLAEILRYATHEFELGVPWEAVEAHMLTCGDCAHWRVRDAV